MLFKLLIAGDGGQGVQTMASLISQAAFGKDFSVSYVPNYGLEQRGGASLAFVQVSDQEVAYPKFTSPDILVIMSDESRERVSEFEKKSKQILDIKDFGETLKENGILTKSYNIFFLGMLARVLEKNQIDIKNEIFSLLENKLKTKQNWEENKKAWELGIEN